MSLLPLRDFVSVAVTALNFKPPCAMGLLADGSIRTIVVKFDGAVQKTHFTLHEHTHTRGLCKLLNVCRTVFSTVKTMAIHFHLVSACLR